MSDHHSSNRPQPLMDRETFIRTFLRKGVEFTEEFVREHQALSERVKQLQEDNAQLRAHLAGEDALRELLAKVEGLEQDRKRLLKRSEQLEHSSREQDGRCRQVEQELGEMANLYIASFQLHGSLSVAQVVSQIGDLLEQLIGARGYVLYVVQPDEETIRPLYARGSEVAELGLERVGSGPVGEACQTGLVWMAEELPAAGNPDAPLAVIPLALEERCVGALTITELLPQKRGWATIDQGLFALLRVRASTALAGANLYARSAGPTAALDGIAEALAASRSAQTNA